MNDLLTFHYFLDNGFDSVPYRQVIEGYFMRIMQEALGGEGLAYLETVENVAPLSYYRHMYLAFLAAQNAQRYGDHFVNLNIFSDFASHQNPAVELSIYAGNDASGKNIEVGMYVDETKADMQREIFYHSYFVNRIASFLNLGQPQLLYRNENYRSYQFHGIGTNLREITRLAFFIIHVLGAYVNDKILFGPDSDYIRSCISCHTNNAKHMCQCHQKSYCSQDCANKDHQL